MQLPTLTAAQHATLDDLAEQIRTLEGTDVPVIALLIDLSTARFDTATWIAVQIRHTTTDAVLQPDGTLERGGLVSTSDLIAEALTTD